MTKEELPDLIGKDAAQKLLAKEPQRTLRTLEGLDLKTGGDWAKALYDRAIPNFLNKYGKKWDAKVGETTLETSKTDDRTFTFPETGTIRTVTNDLRNINSTASGALRTSSGDVLRVIEDGMSMDAAMDSYGTEQLVEAVGGKMQFGKARTDKVHSLDITPAMKKSVPKEGQPISKISPPAIQPTAGLDV
jgi:hypothetical protein